MNSDWFAKYMHHVAANVVERDGSVRFSYKQLRSALDALEAGNEERIPQDVLKLFSNIISVLPPIDLDDRIQITLMLALLNCHMAYHLVTGHLIKNDTSVDVP